MNSFYAQAALQQQAAQGGRFAAQQQQPSLFAQRQVNSGSGYARLVQKKLNIQQCKCRKRGNRCDCDSLPWFGNVCVNDGHSNFPAGHLYSSIAGIAQGLVLVPPIVQTWALSVVTKNVIAVSPAAGYTIADLSTVGLTTNTKMGDLFVISDVVSTPNDPFAGVYRVQSLPTTDLQAFLLEALNPLGDCLSPQTGDALQIRFGSFAMIYNLSVDCTTGAYTTTPTNDVSVNLVRQKHVVGCSSVPAL